MHEASINISPCSSLRTESDAEKLWLPKDSQYLHNKEWKWNNFRKDERVHISLLTHEQNVLNQEALLKVGRKEPWHQLIMICLYNISSFLCSYCKYIVRSTTWKWKGKSSRTFANCKSKP
jgi:predicted DCC family thiol-disulfide oxidoreductase YuxK